jgi:hypothetical protein
MGQGWVRDESGMGQGWARVGLVNDSHELRVLGLGQGGLRVDQG